MGRGELIESLLASQAELQTALGFYRLSKDDYGYSPSIEGRMQASLAMQHAMLARLGNPMLSPTQMPEGWKPA